MMEWHTTLSVDMAPTKTFGAPRGTIKGTSFQNIVSFTIRASPIPVLLLNFLLDNTGTLNKLLHDRQDGKADEDEEGVGMYDNILRKPNVKPEQFWDALRDKCKKVGGEWADNDNKIWAFGPQKTGSCLLIDARKPKALAS